MHSRHQIPSHSNTSRPTSSMESSPQHGNNQTIPSSSPNIVELHPAIPRLSDIDDETEHDDPTNRYTVYQTNHHHHTPHPNKKHSVKYKPTLKKSKSKLKSKTKYNTLTKPTNVSHKATNSSSSSSKSSSTSNTTNTSNSNSSSTSNDLSTSPDSPPIHPKKHKKNTTPNQFEPGYKRWKGANSIFCNGRIIAGPETKKQIRTLCIILIPITIYFATTCVILWTEYNMKYAVVIALLLFLSSLTFFCIVSCIDPGIIPRPELYEQCSAATDVINYISRHQHEQNTVNKIQPTPPWEQRINIDGNVRVLKYCYTCRHFRPPRSFHCNNCDCCIERFDHHCPWLGNCIAKRNYHFYILFLLSINSLCIWVAWTSLYIILSICRHKYNHSTAMTSRDVFIHLWKYDPWPMVTLSLSVFAVFFPMVLLTFHSYLIATGQTTNEKAKNSFLFVSPYSRGCMGNIWEIFCVIAVPASNVHIHHQPPNKNENEAIVNKKKIIYINSQDTKLKQKCINEERKLLHAKNKTAKKPVAVPKNGIIEEEYKSSHHDDSSMDNNDPAATPEEKVPVPAAGYGANNSTDTGIEEEDTENTFYSHKSNNNNYAHIRGKRPQNAHIRDLAQSSSLQPQPRRHHHNIGSNSSADGLGLHKNTVNTKLKRKRNHGSNHKVHRSQSGYVNPSKNKHKRSKYMDTVSQPSHQRSEQESHRDSHKVHSTQSEQIYYYNNEQSAGYHPAYYKISQHNNDNKDAFSFSPLSPVNSKDLNGVVPYYPSPQNIAPIYHDKIAPLPQTGHGTPILSTSINEDNRTLTSTFSQNNPAQHYNKKMSQRQNNLHRQYATQTNTNTNSTLFSPDISSGYGYMDNDNISHTHTNQSSSDYYTTVTAPSHAHTYHPHMSHNRNPFGNHNHGHAPHGNVHGHRPPPAPASLHQTVTASNGGHGHHGHGHRHRDRNRNARHGHRSYSNHQHQHRDNRKGRHKKGYSYGVNDILELSCASNRYDLNGNKYRDYNHSNHRPKRVD